MPTLICDVELERRLRAERALTGADRFDEVWEGTYVMSPLANNEHQLIVSRLTSIFEECIGWPGNGFVFPGVNISDRVDDWSNNFRCPDVAVFMKDSGAKNHETFWHGGPDFAVEVVSKGDRSLEKLEFYARVGTREILVVHRAPWQLELYRLTDEKMQMAGASDVHAATLLLSQVLDFSFELVEGPSDRPSIRVVHGESGNSWLV